MINILHQMSLVEKVFVLSYSSVKQGFYKRDLNDQDTLLSELDQVNESSQGEESNNNMINQIWRSNHSLDFLSFIQGNDKVCVPY